ncbi:cyclic AMP-dependent transcription factor ATF-3-like [Ylistrum balloti]|uniref:cyclic AMP-dependent transcription factor ATF-3-like n=1 Tax=Ylistrum balloti TaxID=509963 RepID=UPI0029059602|nr:cyclic AMP-dependent transcription factor ATF-3-like [Ylistrum balloti]
MEETSSTICEDYDGTKILEAAFVAMKTGSITPIIKQELRFIIQSRRLAEGKSELDVSFVPPVTTELTPEERIKKENRREQNRKASRKFRRKQTVLIHNVKKRMQTLSSENTRLTRELTTLAQEKHSLQEKLRSHLDVCGCVITTAVLV